MTSGSTIMPSGTGGFTDTRYMLRSVQHPKTIVDLDELRCDPSKPLSACVDSIHRRGERPSSRCLAEHMPMPICPCTQVSPHIAYTPMCTPCALPPTDRVCACVRVWLILRGWLHSSHWLSYAPCVCVHRRV